MQRDLPVGAYPHFNIDATSSRIKVEQDPTCGEAEPLRLVTQLATGPYGKEPAERSTYPCTGNQLAASSPTSGPSTVPIVV